MKKKKYLPLYYKWIRSGRLPGGSGLCKAFKETFGDRWLLDSEFFTKGDDTFSIWFFSERGAFTETRQNIVLLLACKNNEL